MSRPKGSTNKKKLTVKDIRKKVEKHPEVSEIQIPVVFPNAAGIKKEEIVPRGIFCKCKHAKDMHYGGLKGHCNLCECLEHEIA